MVALRNQAGSKRMGQLCLLHRGRRREPLAAAALIPTVGSALRPLMKRHLRQGPSPFLYFLPTLSIGVGGLLFATLPAPGIGCGSWGSALTVPPFCWVLRERETGK